MKTALLAFTALLSVYGLAGAGLVRTPEDVRGVAAVWWKPMTNAVAMSKTFGEMYCLGEGGTEGYFKRVLESELSRPGGGDTNILALRERYAAALGYAEQTAGQPDDAAYFRETLQQLQKGDEK